MKNTLFGKNGKIDIKEEKVMELEDTVIENTENETKKTEYKNMKDFSEPWDSFKWLNISQIGVPGWWISEREEIFEQVMVKKFPNWWQL